MDEERRLLYVGITRARKTLALTWCRDRIKYGSPMPLHAEFVHQGAARRLDRAPERHADSARAGERGRRRKAGSARCGRCWKRRPVETRGANTRLPAHGFQQELEAVRAVDDEMLDDNFHIARGGLLVIGGFFDRRVGRPVFQNYFAIDDHPHAISA